MYGSDWHKKNVADGRLGWVFVRVKREEDEFYSNGTFDSKKGIPSMSEP